MSGYPVWNPSAFYTTGEIVSYLGTLYQALQLTSGDVPPSSPSFWTPVGGGGGVVSSVSAGTGISITGTPTNPVVNQTLVGTAGTYAYPASITTDNTGRISAATAGTAPVLSVSAGIGMSISGPAQTPTINNAGIVSVVAGSGIGVAIGPPETATVSNTGVLALTAGTGVSITGSPANYTISATGSGGTLTGIGAGTNISVDNTNPAVPVVSSSSAFNGKVSTSSLTYNLANPFPINMGRINKYYNCSSTTEGSGQDLAVAIIYNGDPLTLGYTNTFANTNGTDNIWINIQSSPGNTYHNVQLNPNQAVVITASEDQSNLFTATRNRYSNA